MICYLTGLVCTSFFIIGRLLSIDFDWLRCIANTCMLCHSCQLVGVFYFCELMIVSYYIIIANEIMICGQMDKLLESRWDNGVLYCILSVYYFIDG